MVWDQDGNLNRFPTPGSDEARARMFQRIRRGAAEKTSELLALDKSSLAHVREYVASPEIQASILDRFDANDDGMVGLGEIRNLNTGTEISVAEFLDMVNHEMRLDTISPEVSRQLGVRITALQANSAEEFFSFNELCSLTREFVGNEEIAKKMCDQLMEAKAAAVQGEIEARANYLNQYIKLAEEQVHKTITRSRAATLINLAQTL